MTILDVIREKYNPSEEEFEEKIFHNKPDGTPCSYGMLTFMGVTRHGFKKSVISNNGSYGGICRECGNGFFVDANMQIVEL